MVRRQKTSRQRYMKPLLGLLVLILVVVVLEVTNTTHFFHAAKPVSGSIPVTSPVHAKASSSKTSSDSNQSSTEVSTTQPSQKAPNSNSGSTSTLPLQTPFGDFVSNHHPNLGGSPAPSSEQSVCNTTPGASCTITFTNSDGIVKSLPPQIADSNGAVYWSWDVKAAGFTAGDWHITATATLNGQSKSASDSLPLSVKS